MLHSGFLRSARRHADRPALVLGGETLTYAEADALARQWAAALREACPELQRVGLFASRSRVSYVGMLAASYAGATVVPLNRSFPVNRTRAMLEGADVDVLLVDRASAEQLPDVLSSTGKAPVVVLPELDTGTVGPADTVLWRADVARLAALERPVEAAADSPAYLLFTSGSTGAPKGVPVSHRNVDHFLAVNAARYGFGPDDRFTQTFDQTFDLSIFDLFMAWQAGGCVVPLEPLHLLAPFEHVRQHDISVWFSVPAVAALLRRKGLLTANSLPSLRWSLFCGEALPAATAAQWQEAAPGSIVENLYGPTEATIACTVHRWDPATSTGRCVNGNVPIGRAYPGMLTLVLDENGVPAAEGELCLGGPQVFGGYWRDPEQTAAKLFVADGRTWYRTGDRVRRQPDGELVYLGRLDHQVKIRGYRVELGEIEAVLSAQPGVAAAVVVTSDEPGGVEPIAFVCGSDLDPAGLDRALRAALPAYMVPRDIHLLDVLPVNTNGKYDRNALRGLILTTGRGEHQS